MCFDNKTRKVLKENLAVKQFYCCSLQILRSEPFNDLNYNKQRRALKVVLAALQSSKPFLQY